MSEDLVFRRAVLAAADRDIARLLSSPSRADALPAHRELMRRAKLLVAAALAPGSAHAGRADAARAAADLVMTLSELQSPSGLFAGGDNVESPPDSAFTVSDVADALELIRRADDPGPLREVATALDRIAERAAPAMLAGGVHTPNHRWELAGALARLHRHTGDPALRSRAETWLEEGVDIDANGMYSERSANYAAHVSNPSLTAIADILGREDLREIVARNLTSYLGLIRGDGSVETVHSRRQDQRDDRFPAAPFLVLYRRYAVETGRGDLAWGAERARASGVSSDALAELLLHPAIGETLPAPLAPELPRRDRWSASGLVVDTRRERTVVVFGGSDYARMRRVRSGLSNSPTFLRLEAGAARLVSARLSRDFFGLGPFRPGSLVEEHGRLVLDERVEGRYYQPLPSTAIRAMGDYALADEGRFAAAMSFDARESDAVELVTRIEITPSDDGADIEISLQGPALAWSLELAFAPGGRIDGAAPLGGGAYQLRDGYGRCTIGHDVIEFGPALPGGPPAFYEPGEDYTYLGGTDAQSGPRVYITGRAPGVARLTLRARGT
ncbi:hypothetical protein [Microbacterium sp. JZ101]